MAYLEIQVRNKKDFDIIKNYSDYSSELTGVCSLSPEAVISLNRTHQGIFYPYLTNKDRAKLQEGIPSPIAKVIDGKVFIENGGIELLHFLDVRSYKFTEMKIVNMWKLFSLIKAGIVEQSPEFIELMKPISLDDHIESLHASTGRMQFKEKKLFGLKDFIPKDYKEGDEIKIRDLDFGLFEPKRKLKEFVSLGEMRVNEFYRDSKTLTFTRDGEHKMYTAKFYFVNYSMLNLFQKGRVLNIAFDKPSKPGETTVVTNPFVLPKGYEMEPRFIIPTSRRVPSELFNAAYAEILFRNGWDEIGEK